MVSFVKNRLIQIKYDKSHQVIFKDLRNPSPNQIDSLWNAKTYTILVIRPRSNAIFLDQPIKPMERSTWYRNGCGLSVINELLVFTMWPYIKVGDIII